jgi:hypothetical protein
MPNIPPWLDHGRFLHRIDQWVLQQLEDGDVNMVPIAQPLVENNPTPHQPEMPESTQQRHTPPEPESEEKEAEQHDISSSQVSVFHTYFLNTKCLRHTIHDMSHTMLLFSCRCQTFLLAQMMVVSYITSTNWCSNNWRLEM